MNFIKSWGYMRILRLIIGVIAIVQAIITADIIIGLMGIIIGGMAFFNTGCCSTSGCDVNYKKDTKQIKDVEYEEVVTEK